MQEIQGEELKRMIIDQIRKSHWFNGAKDYISGNTLVSLSGFKMVNIKTKSINANSVTEVIYEYKIKHITEFGGDLYYFKNLMVLEKSGKIISNESIKEATYDLASGDIYHKDDNPSANYEILD